jgi:hypothetical protein
LANQKQELPVAAMFVNGSGQNVQSLERTSDRDEMSDLYRGPSIDASVILVSDWPIFLNLL